jgi:pilus assembly protein TadC
MDDGPHEVGDVTPLAWIWLTVAVLSAWRFHPPSRRPLSAAPPTTRRRVVPPILGSLPSRRLQRRRDVEIARALPDSVDLLMLAVSAGLTVPLALVAVTQRSEGLVADALGWALSRSQLGEPLADALEAVPAEFGEPMRQLVRPLVVTQRYGTELLPALETLNTDVRRQRRHRAEVVARKLPVKLLFPLVLCILPAFALLTVVPVIASSLRGIQL